MATPENAAKEDSEGSASEDRSALEKKEKLKFTPKQKMIYDDFAPMPDTSLDPPTHAGNDMTPVMPPVPVPEVLNWLWSQLIGFVVTWRVYVYRKSYCCLYCMQSIKPTQEWLLFFCMQMELHHKAKHFVGRSSLSEYCLWVCSQFYISCEVTALAKI